MENHGKIMENNGNTLENHWKTIGKNIGKTLEKTLEKHWKKPSKPIIFVSQAARFILEKMRSRPRSAKHREAVTSAAGPTAEATGDG